MPSITSPHFAKLVHALKTHKATCTVVESCCGGLINASLLAQPGASAVYWGGTVAYDTRRSKPFLLNDQILHQTLCQPKEEKTSNTGTVSNEILSEKERYIQSKVDWTRETSLAFCRQVGTDFCIAQGGAAGPTFRPNDMDKGFTVIAIAARVNGPKDNDDGDPHSHVQVIKQEIFHSPHAHREQNMRLFADKAAQLAHEAILEIYGDTTTLHPHNSKKNDNVHHNFLLEQAQHDISPTYHLDRATQLRSHPDQLDKLRRQGKFIVLHKSKILFQAANEVSDRRLAFLSLNQVRDIAKQTGYNVTESFLGLHNETEPMFGMDFQKQDENENDTRHLLECLTTVYPGAILEDTRTVAPLLAPHTADNELALHATALSQWQRRAPYCPACGGATTLMDGGTSRQCIVCGVRSWPRQDPSMIVVVSSRDQERVLLARSPRHPERLHTALAGFVEAGETLERAVAREVYEETGIRIDLDSVRYVASQPWPFPQSTMIGFLAQADHQHQVLNLDAQEIVEAQWFTRDQVMAAGQVPGPVMQPTVAQAALEANPHLSLLIPPRGVLARTLIETWLNEPLE